MGINGSAHTTEVKRQKRVTKKNESSTMHCATLVFLSLIGAALLAQHSDADPLRDLIKAVP